MPNYDFNYASPDEKMVTPEKFLELRAAIPNLKVIAIIPPSLAKNDYGKIIVSTSDIDDRLIDYVGQYA